MDFMEFKSGSYKKGYEYQYFLPDKLNHLIIRNLSFFRHRSAVLKLIHQLPLDLFQRFSLCLRQLESDKYKSANANDGIKPEGEGGAQIIL